MIDDALNMSQNTFDTAFTDFYCMGSIHCRLKNITGRVTRVHRVNIILQMIWREREFDLINNKS